MKSLRVAIYNRRLATLGGGERYGLTIAQHLSQLHDVSVLCQTTVDRSLAADRLGIDLQKVNFVQIQASTRQQLAQLTRQYDLFINASNWDFFPSFAQQSALVVFFPYDPGPRLAATLRYQIGRFLTLPVIFPLLKLSLLKKSPDLQARLNNLISPRFVADVDTYTHLWAISRFTQRWLQHYWQRPSALLYPPVAVENFQPLPKEQKIVNVGRFFVGNHNKKHLPLVATFKQLVDQGLLDWELHLVGSVNQGELHETYLQQVQAAIGNYPIHIHTAMPLPDLRNLYNRAAIYWHASGYGEDETIAPNKSEHFGITTVEAMAAGCVPIVIAKGGQVEVVEHGVNGLLWHTLPQLVEFTSQLIHDSSQRAKLATAAMEASKRFDQQHFKQRLDQLLAQVPPHRANTA